MSTDHGFVEPAKFNPTAYIASQNRDVFANYQSIASRNPFEASPPPGRESFSGRECYFPPISPLVKERKTDSAIHNNVWVVPSNIRSSETDVGICGHQMTPNLVIGDSPLKQKHLCRIPTPEVDSLNNSPKKSLDSRSKVENGNHEPQHALTKSLSDTAFVRPGFGSRNGGSVRRKNLTIDQNTIPLNHWLNTIDEQDVNYAKSFYVEASSQPVDATPPVRSPLKKLFGERGILGRSISQKDLPDPRYKKPERVAWSERLKHRIEELSRDVSAALPSIDLSKRAGYPLGPSNFPVTLSPYAQGDFYMQFELLLNIETNRFIMSQFKNGHISMESIKKIVEAWKSKGRPQVIGFRYDLATQRDLVVLNADTIHFCGVNAFNRPKLHFVLASWKALAREVSVRTFCQPDSVIRKHLHDAEKILELIDAAPESMLAFQEMRSRIITNIYRQEKLERERELNGVERAWSPMKLDPQIDVMN